MDTRNINKIKLRLLHLLMSRLAESVLEKIRLKKEEEERNQPHIQVLRLLVEIEVKDYYDLEHKIKDLEQTIRIEQQFAEQLNEGNLLLESTGKMAYPRIIIKPDFIGSDRISAPVKEFYRKAANTFLREDLLKRKQYELDCEKVKAIKQHYTVINSKQQEMAKIQQDRRNTVNEKTVKNLKEDLRRRALQDEQEEIKRAIDGDRGDYKSLLAQYELKKVNLGLRTEWSQKLAGMIKKQRNIIKEEYNPAKYRGYLSAMFNICTKNSCIQKNLAEAERAVEVLQNECASKQRFLEKSMNLFVQGKSSIAKKRRSSLSSPVCLEVSDFRKKNLLASLKKSINVQANDSSPIKRTKRGSPEQTTIGSTNTLLKDTKDTKEEKRRCLSVSTDLKDSKRRQY